MRLLVPFLSLFAMHLSAQIVLPATPQVNTVQPLIPGKQPIISPPANSANQKAMEMMGYKPPIVPPSDPALLHQFILSQYKNAPDNRTRQQKELQAILAEDRTPDYLAKENATLQTSAEYINAYNRVAAMLNDNNRLSVKDAYYYTESAYGSPYVKYEEYNSTIKQSAEFIKNWLLQHGFKLTDNNALNIGIQRFISDTLTITVKLPDSETATKQVKHLPFVYDYDDYKGERDFRNYFATKTFATGSGQCSSLPAVYLILAEALGAKAYLTFAPMHSFIKYPGTNGIINNYEPTSNWNISDKWYIENLFISRDAIYSGIYLDTLNSKQVVANCLLDLAHSYMYRYGVANDTFLKQCVNTAITSFPQRNNINAYFINSSYQVYKLKAAMKRDGINDISQINRSAAATALYNEYLRTEDAITRLGYRDMPPQMYQALMQEQEFKGRKHAATGVQGKQKVNMFIETK